MLQGFSHFSAFLHHFVLIRLGLICLKMVKALLTKQSHTTMCQFIVSTPCMYT